jgi:hypothetical protein
MTKSDEEEAHRLCDVLRSLHHQASGDALKSEALKKAGLAVSLGFMRGLRPEIESFYRKLGAPLSEEESAELRKMGLLSDE